MPQPDTPGGPTPTPTPRPVAPLPNGVSPADYMERVAGLWAAENQDDSVDIKTVTNYISDCAAVLRAAEL